MRNPRLNRQWNVRLISYRSEDVRDEITAALSDVSIPRYISIIAQLASSRAPLNREDLHPHYARVPQGVRPGWIKDAVTV